jgi:hypothetical protein
MMRFGQISQQELLTSCCVIRSDQLFNCTDSKVTYNLSHGMRCDQKILQHYNSQPVGHRNVMRLAS